MKRIMFTILGLAFLYTANAQTDTTGTSNGDTVKVGNFIIIKKNKDKSATTDTTTDKDVTIHVHIGDNDYDADDAADDDDKKKRITSTNWFILDLGFANYRDQTDYNTVRSYLDAMGGKPFTSDDLKLITGKSSNVNFWLFMQKLNVTKNVVNLKYGLGLEMYNFRYKNPITYRDNPPSIFRDSVSFSKNKLFVDYVTIPFMLNIDPSPQKRSGFSFSAGVSAGYRIGSRNKQISDARGKDKIQGDFDLDPWRFAYVAEMGIGPVRLYGSYSINALHLAETGVKQYPYVVGVRLSNW